MTNTYTCKSLLLSTKQKQIMTNSTYSQYWKSSPTASQLQSIPPPRFLANHSSCCVNKGPRILQFHKTVLTQHVFSCVLASLLCIMFVRFVMSLSVPVTYFFNYDFSILLYGYSTIHHLTCFTPLDYYKSIMNICRNLWEDTHLSLSLVG